MTSETLLESLGTAMAVDGETGDTYVAGFKSSSSGDESGDQIVVHKVGQGVGREKVSLTKT